MNHQKLFDYLSDTFGISALESEMHEIEIICNERFVQWGAIGGKKSTRKLTSQEAKHMVAIREQKRAQKKVENNACVS